MAAAIGIRALLNLRCHSARCIISVYIPAGATGPGPEVFINGLRFLWHRDGRDMGLV